MISQEMIYDAEFNALSVEAQLLFVRMLAVSDDCGVLPADVYELTTLTNPPKKIRGNLEGYLGEIRGAGLMTVFEYDGKKFLLFKRESFDTHQSYLLNKRTRSEYLKISYEDFVELSNKFQEVPGNSWPVKQKAESRKQEVEGRKQKEVYGEFHNVLLTAEEFQAIKDHLGGVSRAESAIAILGNYKESKGKTYRSDYAAMKTWVFDELKKRENDGGLHTGRSGSGRSTQVSPNKVTPPKGKYDGVETIIDTSGKQ